MITVKSNYEIDRMRESGAIVAKALAEAERNICEGITTFELSAIIEDVIRGEGAIPSFKNYNGFPAAACISIDEVVVHGIPSNRKLCEGQIVSVDVGAVKNGYHGDAARTFAVGKISAEKQQLIDVTKESFFKGLMFVKSGNRLGDVSNAIQKYAESFGYGVVREMVGHGIGKKLHEDPCVPNFGTSGTGVELKKGFALAIEPMITMGARFITFAADGWTCMTRDKSPSAHYENTVIVTDGEPEILTLY